MQDSVAYGRHRHAVRCAYYSCVLIGSILCSCIFFGVCIYMRNVSEDADSSKVVSAPQCRPAAYEEIPVTRYDSLIRYSAIEDDAFVHVYFNDSDGGTYGDEDSDDDIFITEDSFDAVDEILKGRTDVSFSDIYSLIRAGDIDSALSDLLALCADSLTYELRSSKAVCVQLLAVIILGSTLAQVPSHMGSYVTENSFLVTYMILVSLLLAEFVVVQSIVTEALNAVLDFMKAFYPMYASSMLYVQGSASAQYSESVIVLVIYICQNVVLAFVLPLIKCSGILSLANNLNREDYFSKMAELTRSLAGWTVKTIFALVTGINVVKCMIAPSMDRISRSGIIKSLGRMSGMATVGAVASVIISTGEFIKDCLGVTCTVIIVIMSLVPMIKIFVIMLALRCIAALVQPIGDRRYADGVSSMARTVELMLKACGVCVMMFVLSIALMTVGGG